MHKGNIESKARHRNFLIVRTCAENNPRPTLEDSNTLDMARKKKERETLEKLKRWRFQ